ncbi:hypothetical protein F5Y09DRAFT_345111 [Xylaria sp. FL1042]|nr:hypothetical protein F5Y09DRAFT_345111 [Xylaria sp. FL1042]
METQISNNAQQQSFEVLSPELMIRIIEIIPPFDWPDYWNLGLTCHKWQYEVKNLFRKRHLTNMIIQVPKQGPSLIEASLTFEIAEEVSGDRAVFKPQGRIKSKMEWEMSIAALRKGDMGEDQLYMITLPDICVVNNTELVGLQEDYSAQRISIEWFPTLSALFREERQLREFLRIEVEERLRQFSASRPQGASKTTKAAMYYMLHAHYNSQISNMRKVRKRYRNERNNDSRGRCDYQLRNYIGTGNTQWVPFLRSKMKLAKAYISPTFWQG